jgi:TonB family protein
VSWFFLAMRVFLIPPASLRSGDKEALAAARAGNYAEAANGLKQLLELEPAHSSARNELGRIYLRQDQLDLAAASFRKQIEMNPSDPYAYNNLGLVLERQGKWEEAVQSFRKQLQINPDDRNAHENLAFLFEKQQKYTLAAPELQRAVAANPKNPALLVALASVYRKSGEEEKCKSALRNAEKIAETPQSWNSIAWFMALREFSLDEALKYAQRAVASVATSLSAVSLDHITSRELHDVSALASYWDTLGWVYFQRKELPNAEKYLLAAWQLRHDGVIGNHIGQVYEKLGRKDDAIRHYSLSLATPNPEPGTSDRLVALAGKDAISAEKLAAYSDQLAETSVVQIPGAPKIDVAADFYVELAPAQMPNVRFICGNPALKSLTGLLPSAPYELSFPDSQPVKLILRGELTCGGSDAACRLKLLSPSVASLESPDAPGTVEILGDTMGVSFSTYSQALRESVRANWLKLAPEKARSPNKNRANVSIFFAILRDGKLDQLDISRSSGDVELDRAAFDAILRAAPFPPLPSGFARSSISFRFNFHYNPGPDSCVTNGAL